MKTKTLEQMEARAAATPLGAVLLWLAQYVKDKAAVEHMLGLDHGTGRDQVREQLEAAIRAEMRGERPERIYAAVRQAKMEAEFLMRLATETGRGVLQQLQTCRPEIDLARERLRNAELRGAATRECTPEITSVGKSVLGEKLMCDMIRHAYFDGQPIMLSELAEKLEAAVERVEELIADHDRQAEEKIEGEEFRSQVRAAATVQSKLLELDARLKMLNQFGEYREAQRVAQLHALSLFGEMQAHCLKYVRPEEQTKGSQA